MFKNYFILTLRMISRQKVSSLIAILGLALGLTCALLLYNYIDYHLSYEDFMPEGNDVKRLVISRIDDNGSLYYSGEETISPYAAKLLVENVSSVEEIATKVMVRGRLFHVNDGLYREFFNAVSSNYFDMIPLPLIEGDRDSLLVEPNSLVLDRIFAEKYFPAGDALGREIIFHDDESHNLKITGVVDIPKNSHLHREKAQAYILGDLFLSKIAHDANAARSDMRITVYFTPDKNYDKAILKDEIGDFMKTIPENDEYTHDLFYENFNTIHLFSKVNGSNANNPLYMIIFLGSLTAALLIISIVNTISILTALSITRTREVGVRLVMGGSKNDLIFQFLTESIVLSFISLIIALVMTELLQPAFSNLVELDLDYSYTPAFLLYTVLLTLLVGFLAGIFPAFYLSSLKPVESLKGNKLIKLKVSKKVLVVVQFLFTSIILIWALTVNNELHFVQNMDIGFDSDNLISVYPGRWGFGAEGYEKLKQLRDELKRIDGVEEVAYTSWVPMLGGSTEGNTYLHEDGVTTYQEYYSYVDRDYLETLGVDLVAGKVEAGSVIVMKVVSDYRNLEIGDLVEIDSEYYRVSAIMDNYYLQSALQGYQNFFHIVSEDSFRYQIIKTSKRVNLREIKTVWKSIFPRYYLIEFNYLKKIVYEENFPHVAQIIIKVINIAMIITLFISAAGLFGLTLHTIKQKTKEIGIRKVLGAGILSVLYQFYKETVSLILIAIVIGIPLAVFSVNNGIYALGYSLPIHDMFKILLFSAAAILLSGILLIGTMVAKAAMARPGAALRYE